MNSEKEIKKKTWKTPQLTVLGDVQKITSESSVPPKNFGGRDGAIWSDQNNSWDVS